MKKIRCVSLVVVSTVLSFAVHAAPVVEEPAVMSEAMLSITVSDLHGLIDEVGLVAAQVSPMMNGMMIKGMVGMQLGDPNLSGIAPGKGLAVVALDPTNVFSVIEVSEVQSELYSNAAIAQGMQAIFTNGVLIVANSDDVITKAITLSGTIQSELLTKRSPTLRIAAHPAAMIEENNELVMGFVQKLPQLMETEMAQSADTNSMANLSKILEGEVRLLVSLASQIEAIEVVLAPEKGSLKISETYVSKKGTRLATLCNSPKTSNASPKLQAGLLGEGMVMFDFAMANPEAISTFIIAEVEQILADMKLENIDLSGAIANLTKWMKVYNGAGCEIFDFDVDDGMSLNYLNEVTDEAAALELFKTMDQDMALILGLYKSLGIEMSFEFKENDREYKGIQIHELEMKFAMEDVSEEQQKQLDALDMDDLEYDIAIFDGKVLLVMGEVEIEKTIDRVQNADITVVPVEARNVYPEGGFYYSDFDIGRYVEFISALVPAGMQNPINQQVVALLQGVDSITSAGFRDEGRVMWSVNIPSDLIGKIAQIGVLRQMQNMQQQPGMGAPAAAPVQE